MATVRLDYDDAYQTQFDAVILEMTERDGRPAIVLDQTCFYPTSGGQLHDIGLLGGQRVLNVEVDDNGNVLHYLEALPAGAAIGVRLDGRIDWTRRYDHMQQHSGQHLLSQVLAERFGYETLSVHFGATASTIDVAVDSFSADEVRLTEELAQEQIFANLPIRSYFVDEQALATLPLRKPPLVRDHIRIVEIEHYDYSACGGTHVRQTGEIGPVKLIKQERVRGGTRLTFLCGWRAVYDYASKSRILNEAAACFSTEMPQVPELIERLQAENKALQRSHDALQEQLLRYKADALLAAAFPVGEQRLVAAVLPDVDAAALKTLAHLLQETPQIIALLAGVHDEKVTILFARGEAVDLHMGNLLRQALQQFGGGGGGRPELAQGGGINPNQADALIDFARTHVNQELTP